MTAPTRVVATAALTPSATSPSEGGRQSGQMGAKAHEAVVNKPIFRPTPAFHRFQTALMTRFMTILPVVPIS